MIRKIPPTQMVTAADLNALIDIINNQNSKIQTAGAIGAEYNEGRYVLRDGTLKPHYARLTERDGPDANGIYYYAHNTVERVVDGWDDMPTGDESEYEWGTTTVAPAMSMNDDALEVPRIARLYPDPSGNGYFFDDSYGSNGWKLLEVTGPLDTTGYGHGYQPGVILDEATKVSTGVHVWIDEVHDVETELPYPGSPLGPARVWGKFLGILAETGTEEGLPVYAVVFGKWGTFQVVVNNTCSAGNIVQTKKTLRALWFHEV